jgi:hypothetical protein
MQMKGKLYEALNRTAPRNTELQVELLGRRHTKETGNRKFREMSQATRFQISRRTLRKLMFN